MLTLAFAQLGYAMLFRFRDITGGSDGIVGIPRPSGPFGMTWFQGKIGYYYLVLGCLLGLLPSVPRHCALPVWRGALRHSRKRG